MTVSQIQKIERMKLMKKKMKKIVSILCMMSLLFSMLTVKVNASNDDIKVLVDGTELTFDVPPQIIDDYTMVPMRGIFEALGYDVVWDEENKQIVANRNSQFIIMTLDEKAYLNITGGVKDMSKTDIQKYYGKILDNGVVEDVTIIPMKLVDQDDENKKYYYTAKIQLTSGGNYGYTFRVMPKHEMLLEAANLDLIKWITK